MYKPLIRHMCLIIPNGHIESFRLGIFGSDDIGSTMEEQTEFENELNLVKERIIECYKRQLNANCVFIETCKNITKSNNMKHSIKTYHTMIECYPISLKNGLFDVMKSYFEKAIEEECDSLWQTNKKLIKVSKERPLNKFSIFIFVCARIMRFV